MEALCYDGGARSDTFTTRRDKKEETYERGDHHRSPSLSPSSSWDDDSYPRHSTPKASPVIERPTTYHFGQSLLFPYKLDILSPPTISRSTNSSIRSNTSSSSHNTNLSIRSNTSSSSYNTHSSIRNSTGSSTYSTSSTDSSLTRVDLTIPFETYLQNLGDSLRKSHKNKSVTTSQFAPEAKKAKSAQSLQFFAHPLSSHYTPAPYFRYIEGKQAQVPAPYPGIFVESLTHPAFRQTDNLTTTKSALEDKSSTTAKKYKCDVCEKTFSRSNTLVTHKRIHTGEKPFKCEICDRAFRQPGNLTRHRLTHTSLKPYVCGTCNKAFNRASNLQTHMRIHNKGIEYNREYGHL